MTKISLISMQEKRTSQIRFFSRPDLLGGRLNELLQGLVLDVVGAPLGNSEL